MASRATRNRIGRSLELFFIDGKPDGMLTAEVFNWTGHILRTPRSRLTDALQRKEAAHTGVYLLVSEGDDSTQIYIGEGQDIGSRIKSHDTRKDWWDTAVLITAAADSLDKAHIQYLEARLLREAKEAGRAKIENDNEPTIPSLSEAAETNMEAFLEHVAMILPALGVDCFVHNKRTRASTPSEAMNQQVEAEFELHSQKHGLHATARMEDGEFIVEAESQARSDWKGTEGSYKQLYLALVQNGILAEGGSADHGASQPHVRVFRTDYAFRSPSAAAAVVNGRSANGRSEWKVRGQEKTYAEWEIERLGLP